MYIIIIIGGYCYYLISPIRSRTPQRFRLACRPGRRTRSLTSLRSVLEKKWPIMYVPKFKFLLLFFYYYCIIIIIHHHSLTTPLSSLLYFGHHCFFLRPTGHSWRRLWSKTQTERTPPQRMISSDLSYPVVVAWATWTLFSIGVLVLAFRRRDRQPLKARSPTLTFVSAVGGYILLTWCTFVYGNVFNALNIHDEALCSVSVWALYIGQPMLLFPYLLRCYRLYFVFNYNIEQNENVRRNQFISNNSPRRNAGGRSGRSSPVNGHFPSDTVRSSAAPGTRRGNSLSPSRNPSRRRAKDGNSNNMDDLAEIFYNDPSLSNSSEKDFFHKYSHRMSESWLLQRFLMLLSVFVIYGIVNQLMILQLPDSDYVRFNVCTHVHLGFVLEWELIEFVEQVIFVMALYKLWDVIDAFNISVSNALPSKQSLGAQIGGTSPFYLPLTRQRIHTNRLNFFLYFAFGWRGTPYGLG